MNASAGSIDERPVSDGRDEIASRLASVRERIGGAARRAGREPEDVVLVAVCKGVDPGLVAAAVSSGAMDLGENRAQELTAKMAALAAVSPGPRWHFVGSLQRNKVRAVTGRVALIHSVGSTALGRAIAARAAGLKLVQDVLLEVNVSGETSKHGLSPAETQGVLEALSSEPALQVRGLMTIAPPAPPAEARAAFRGLRDLRDRLRETSPGVSLDDLSMGMSSDFEEAIEEGSTIVRIGTAMFGARKR